MLNASHPCGRQTTARAGRERYGARQGERTCGVAVTLSHGHRHELDHGSAIDPAVIAERGYKTIQGCDRGEVEALGISLLSDHSFPGLLIPMFRATGEQISAQFKPAKPVTIKGRSVKYLS